MNTSAPFDPPAAPGRWRWQRRGAPYLFVAPFLIVFLLFWLYPLAFSAAMSLDKTSGARLHRFVGLANYRFMVRDVLFWLAALNTLLYAVLFLLIQLPASLGLALLLDSPRIRARALFRLAFFSTYLVGQVFAAVIFLLMLAPHYGLLNRVIGAIDPGIGSDINWRSHAILGRAAIVMAGCWLTIGYGMIYFLAALQAISRELYEAAEVDGAGAWSRFWHVTLPGIMPILLFLLLVGAISSLQLFELPYLFFQGPGPKFAGVTIVTYLYGNGFELGDLGYASAVGWVLAALTAMVMGSLACLIWQARQWRWRRDRRQARLARRLP